MCNLSRKQKGICFSSTTMNKFAILSYVDVCLGVTSTLRFRVFKILYWFTGGFAMQLWKNNFCGLFDISDFLFSKTFCQRQIWSLGILLRELCNAYLTTLSVFVQSHLELFFKILSKNFRILCITFSIFFLSLRFKTFYDFWVFRLVFVLALSLLNFIVLSFKCLGSLATYLDYVSLIIAWLYFYINWEFLWFWWGCVSRWIFCRWNISLTHGHCLRIYYLYLSWVLLYFNFVGYLVFSFPYSCFADGLIIHISLI